MKKVYQLLAIFLCLATPSFSSTDGKFSESDVDPTICNRMYYGIAKCIHEIPYLDSEPLRTYAVQHPEYNNIIQIICDKIMNVKELNTFLLEKLRTFNPAEMDIFQKQIFKSKNGIHETFILRTDSEKTPGGLYYITAKKLQRASNGLTPEILEKRVGQHHFLDFQSYRDICIAMEDLKTKCISLMEDLDHFKDGTFHINNLLQAMSIESSDKY